MLDRAGACLLTHALLLEVAQAQTGGARASAHWMFLQNLITERPSSVPGQPGPVTLLQTMPADLRASLLLDIPSLRTLTDLPAQAASTNTPVLRDL